MLRYDLYTMNIDKKRNYYSCRDFGHLAKNCKNQKLVEQRSMKYRNNPNNRNNCNLNEKENLIVFN